MPRGRGHALDARNDHWQGSPSPKRADKRRIVSYRAGLWLDLLSVALCATVVGNREEPSGGSRITLASGQSTQSKSFRRDRCVMSSDRIDA